MIKSLVVFSLYVAIMLLNAGCGCFGPSPAGNSAITACNSTITISGTRANASITRRFGPHRDWVAARSQLNVDVRAEAEAAAKSSFDDAVRAITCPEECPNPTPMNQPSYDTNSGLSGSKGWGWIRYDAWADSQMSQDFQCQ